MTRTDDSFSAQEEETQERAQLTYEDWVDLNSGEKVLIKRPREIAAYGTVDDISDDASCFWVWLDEDQGRVLISEGDGSTVWASRTSPRSSGDLFADTQTHWFLFPTS